MIDFEKDFAIFILSHNRVDKIDTLNMLEKIGYKGKWYVVISTDNTQVDRYKKKIPKENLLIFDKKEVKVDTMYSTMKFEPRSAVYARNFIIDYATPRYKYFLMADDDIRDIKFKVDLGGHIKDMDAMPHITQILRNFVDYLDSSDNLAGLAFAIGSGYFGGVRSIYKMEREVCVFIVFKSSHIRRFRGIQCEDVILSCDNFDQVYLTWRGGAVIIPQRGQNAGGNDYDTQSLPPNMFWWIAAPSAVKVTGRWSRLRFNKKLYPCIIREDNRK